MTAAPAPARAVPAEPAVRGPAVPWWSVVLPLAVLIALADQFWVVALRTSVGAIERTSDPATSWLRESAALLPWYVAAVVGALALALRWFGRQPRGPWPTLGTIALVAGATTLAAALVLTASSLYDYQLQLEALAHHAEEHRTCVGSCLETREQASLALQLRAVAVGTVLLLATNLLLLGWVVALRGRPLPAATGRVTRAARRPRPDDRVLLLALLLAGSAVVHAAVVPDHWAGWRPAGAFFLAVELAQLTAAAWVWRRPDRAVLVLAALGSAGLVALWAVSRTAGVPFGPEAGEPEAVGLADLAAGVLEVAAVVLCLQLLRSSRRQRGSPRRWQAHARGVAVATVVAVTVLGVGGSGLPGVDLLSGTGHTHGATEDAGE